jgi:hypothetical protein
MVILAIGSVVFSTAATSYVALDTQDANLSGLVLDVGKARIPGAQILVEGNGLRRTVTSADDGSYSIQLPDGKYRVIATKGGFYPSRKKTVRIRANAKLTLDVTLKGIRHDSSHP